MLIKQNKHTKLKKLRKESINGITEKYNWNKITEKYINLFKSLKEK